MENGGPSTGDELFRMNALNAVLPLQFSPQQRFSQYVESAAGYFGVPLALLSIITLGRKWMNENHGMALDWIGHRSSMCHDAIRSCELLVVPDLQQDARFSNNPFVIGPPFLRSYAGMPLLLESGHRIGTVCLFDMRVREYDQLQCDMLTSLASLVLSELDAKGGWRNDPP